MTRLITYLKNRLYFPSLKNRTEIAFEISRIIVSFILGITTSVESYLLYFRYNPLLGVSFVGEVTFFVIGFALIYFLFPFIMGALNDFIKNIVQQALKDLTTNIQALQETAKKPKKPTIAASFSKPVLLDTSSIIDGRVLNVIKEGFLDALIVVPQFVLDELQLIADSADKQKRKRGRRGLDILNQIKKASGKSFKVYPHQPVDSVDKALVDLAKKLKGVVATTDYNLNKVAKIKGIKILNINSLANAVKTTVLPGDSLKVKLVKEGENNGQGVGYLDDGTMVVVTEGIKHLNKQVDVEVEKILQTDAGQLIFAYFTTSFSKQKSKSSAPKKIKKTLKATKSKGK